jgi:hypothetical protein
MQSLQRTRTRVAGYAGPADMTEYARKLARDARAEQSRMDLIRAEQLRANARKATR